MVNEEKHNEKSLLGETVCVGDSVITMRVDRVGGGVYGGGRNVVVSIFHRLMQSGTTWV